MDIPKRFEKLDRISIDTKKQGKDMVDWGNNNLDLVYNYRQVLKEGLVIFVHEKGSYIHFKELDNNSTNYDIIAGGMISNCTYNKTLRKFEDITMNGEKIDKDLFSKNVIDMSMADRFSYMSKIKQLRVMLHSQMFIHITLMAYMENFESDTAYVYSKSEKVKLKAPQKKKDKKKGKKTKVVIINRSVHKVYINEDIAKEKVKGEGSPKSAHTRHGHWRVYKNKDGSFKKKVWINQIEVGKDKKEGKTYKLK